MSNKIDKRISEHTERQAGEFLFNTKDLEGNSLEARTRVNSKESLKVLNYYGTLNEIYGSVNAKKIVERLERIFIAHRGLGRVEAVETLKQNFPKKVEIERGSDRESTE